MVPSTILCSNALPSYNALAVLAFSHFQVSYSKSYLEGHTEPNGMENYWNQDKHVLRKYTGIPAIFLYLFLKECDFRFN